MATENIPQIDRTIKEWGVAFRKAMKEANKAIEDARNEWRKFESEEKSMLHNVTVKHEENKVLEQYWVMRAVVGCDLSKKVIAEKELPYVPRHSEIAQFLSDSKADFVSVVQNYRFESELPFC